MKAEYQQALDYLYSFSDYASQIGYRIRKQSITLCPKTSQTIWSTC